jgi:hypothetical protein
MILYGKCHRRPLPQSVDGINVDLLDVPLFEDFVHAMYQSGSVTVSTAKEINVMTEENMIIDQYYSTERQEGGYWTITNIVLCRSFSTTGVHKALSSFHSLNRRIQAFSWGVLPWERYFSDLLPADVVGLICVLQSTCDQTFTFAIYGPNATFVGDGNIQNSVFESLVVETSIHDFGSIAVLANETSNRTGPCGYSLSIYPTELLRENYTSSRPEYFTIGLLTLFAFTAIVFLIFVYVSRHRQDKVMAIALSTSAIKASLFPTNVRDRLHQDAEEEALRKIEEGKQERLGSDQLNTNNNFPRSSFAFSTSTDSGADGGAGLENAIVRNFIRNCDRRLRSGPIADLFPEVTISTYPLNAAIRTP